MVEWRDNDGVAPVERGVAVDVDIDGVVHKGLMAGNVCWELSMPAPLVVRRWRLSEHVADVDYVEFEVTDRVREEGGV